MNQTKNNSSNPNTDTFINPDFLKLRHIFKATHPHCAFRGMNLHQELSKLEAQLAFNQASVQTMQFVEKAIEVAKQAVNEQYERNEIAFLLLRNLEKFNG
jgi:hypothetical protein